ncbi:MAG: leucine-rich repeat domain-containing protein [Acidobacteriota bacterium]
MLNTANVAANIEVVSLTQGGAVVGRTQRVLRGRQREALLVQEWIPAAAGISGGSVFVKSDQPVVATQLFGTQSFSALANVPPQKVTTNFDPAAHLPRLRVFPPLAVVETGKTKQFNGEGISGAGWLVNDVAGGNSSIGTVSETGLYRAPTVAPAQHTFTIRAADTANQSAGASVDVVQRETLVAGLTQVTAVAYLENLHRFFIAEQQILTSITIDASSPRATTTNARISEQSSSGTTTVFTQINNETIGKIVPFVDASGTSYMLIAGTDSGKIYRLNVLDKKLDTVASGLNKPNSLALDPISRNLLVSEEGANQITIVERSKFDPLAAAAVVTDPDWRKRPKAVAVASPRGVAIDGCGGAVYTTSADGQLREYKGNRIRTVYSGLNNPNEILVLYREGFPSCQEALSLLVVVNNEVLQVFPQTGQAIPFLSGIANVLDLVFFPKGSPFILQGEQAVGLAEAPPGAAASRISDVRIGGLYENVGAQAAPPAEPSVSKLPFQDPRGDTFAGSLSSSNNLQAPDLLSIGAQQLSGATVITLTFARPVAPLSAAAANSVSGFVDFDLRPGSGVAARADSYNSFAPTGMGVDYYVDLSSGVLRDVAASRDIPITLQFRGENLTLQIPLTVVNLSGARMTVVVGNRLEITDLAPNAGVIEFIAPAAACSEGIKIIDANLDTAVRAALKISSSTPITCELARSLTALDAAGKGIQTLAGLEHFSNLETLQLYGNSISDLTPLSGLVKLRALNLGCSTEVDEGFRLIGEFVNLPGLILNCTPPAGSAPNNGTFGNPVRDITALANLTNLVELRLDANRGADIRPLSQLKALKTLSMYENAISDVSALAGLVGLTTLLLGQNHVGDIRPLSGLTGLAVLDLDENVVSDISPLAGLSGLRILGLSTNQISSIQPVASLNGLVVLFLDDNPFGGDLRPISGLRSLRYLEITGASVVDLSPLSGLTLLQSLALNRNAITDISPLSKLANLKELDLAENRISDITALSGMGALEFLDLGNYNQTTGANAVTNLSPLAGLTKLWYLSLEANGPANLSPLSGLTALTDLNLHRNAIAGLAPLSSLTNLQYLFLARNAITDITPLAGLVRIVKLVIHSNRITSIAALSSLTDLQDLSLSGNSVSDIGPLVSNPGLGTGDTIDLSYNNLLTVRCPDLKALVARGAAVQYEDQKLGKLICP